MTSIKFIFNSNLIQLKLHAICHSIFLFEWNLISTKDQLIFPLIPFQWLNAKV